MKKKRKESERIAYGIIKHRQESRRKKNQIKSETLPDNPWKECGR